MLFNLLAAAALPLACLAGTLAMVLVPKVQRSRPLVFRIDGSQLSNVIDL
jgi:hypothetical protein